jgi:hypothetical protein
VFKSGDFLTFVYNDNGAPRVGNVRIESEEPMTVLLPASDWGQSMTPGTKVSLVGKGPNGGAHADATITQMTKYGLNLVVELSDVDWTPFDRRRAPRFPVSLESEITVVNENGGIPEFNRVKCNMIDLSSVGCRLQADLEFEPATLLAVAISIPGGEPLRMLSVVTRIFDDPAGCALEFFDFVGTTRFRLDEFLSSLPQAA